MKAFEVMLDELKAKCGLEKKRLLIVGVSSGADSLSLLHLLRGRPTMVHLSIDMLEKQFGRRGAR